MLTDAAQVQLSIIAPPAEVPGAEHEAPVAAERETTLAHCAHYRGAWKEGRAPVVYEQIRPVSLRRLVRHVEVALAHARTARPHDPGLPDRTRIHVVVENVDIRIWHRRADREELAGRVQAHGVDDGDLLARATDGD